MRTFSKEVESKPVQITMLRVPSGERLVNKGVYDVLGCKLYWQNRGEYMVALTVTKHKNSTKPKGSILEVFFTNKRQIFSESINLDFIALPISRPHS